MNKYIFAIVETLSHTIEVDCDAQTVEEAEKILRRAYLHQSGLNLIERERDLVHFKITEETYNWSDEDTGEITEGFDRYVVENGRLVEQEVSE